MGWDKLSNFVTEYQTALDGLGKGELSDLVVSQFGIHIIKCTDTFEPATTTADDGTVSANITSVSELPEEFQEVVKTAAKNQKSTENYQAWLTSERESADIVINPMPEDVPYNVDMSQYSATNGLATEDNGTVDETITEDETQGTVPEGGEGADDAQTEGGEGEGQDGEGQQTEGTE